MKKIFLINCLIFTIASCSSSLHYDVLAGRVSVEDQSVSDELLCLTAFTSEVKIPKSKIQQNILDEIIRRNITPEQCSSYVISNAGGVDSFCSDFNYGYLRGKSTAMPSFGNYITLQDMLSVQKTLGIDCNTKQYVERHLRDDNSAPMDFSKSWRMFQTNTINCSSIGTSKWCSDSNGNSFNINHW